MLESNLIPKFERKIERCNKHIKRKVRVELRKEQIRETEKEIRKIKHIRHTITTWEKVNQLWFNGTESDVYTFDDLLDYCNQLQFGETPLDIIREQIFIPVGGSAIAPYDLREYLYLPSSLIEEDKDIHNIREAFDGFGEDIVQL